MRRKCSMVRLAAVLMGAALTLSGCGSGGAGQNSDSLDFGESIGVEDTGVKGDSADMTESGKSDAEVTGYYFMSGDVKIAPDMDMDGLKLAEAKSVFEAPSCAGEGISYLYDFGAYEIETYPAADGKNRIGYITLKNDIVATVEGIDLSMNREDVIRVYGNEYEEADNMICYEKQGAKLKFIFEGENIISIEYASAVIG